MPIVVLDPESRLVIDQPGLVYVVQEWAAIEHLSVLKTTPQWCLVNLSSTGQIPHDVPADCIIEIGKKNKYEGLQHSTLSYICNPDGSVRWLFPAVISSPWFLAFYSTYTRKARFFAALVKTLFAFRLNTLVSNGFVTLHTRKGTFVEQLVQADSRRNYAIFTGTTGLNRKIVVADADRGYVSRFLKIALNETAAHNLHNECTASEALDSLDLSGVVFPKARMIDEQVLELSNIKPLHATQSNPDTAPVPLLDALYQKTLNHKSLGRLKALTIVERRLNRIAQLLLQPSPITAADILKSKLFELLEDIRATNKTVPVAVMHGDLTPWNMYATAENVHVFDWELSQPDMPLLHDWFHYCIQTAVLVEHTPPEQILPAIHQLLKAPDMVALVERYQIDTALHLQLYLLQTASYYLELYLLQPKLHQQAFWLLKAWYVLLQQTNTRKQAATDRASFIPAFFHFLKEKRYVLLKQGEKNIQAWPETSDIDLLVTSGDLLGITEWAAAGSSIQHIKIVRKSAMTTLHLFFYDGGYLCIDLLTAFHRKGLEYLDPALLLHHFTWQNGVKVSEPAFEYLYTWLFYQLNGAGVPEKYASVFANLPQSTKADCLAALMAHTGQHFDQLEDSFAAQHGYQANTRTFLNTRTANRFSSRLNRWIGYIKDAISDTVSQRGFMVTFSGVDGAGKTTILTATKTLLEKKYRKKVVVLRHRPSVLPILSAWRYGKVQAEQKSVAALPRTGNNQSKLSSLLRFGYYFADYIVGQWLVYAQYILRGYIVLYDRYYFDFIVDSKRSNMESVSGLAKRLYPFIQKPALNFFLFAQPEVILQRKKELSAADIRSLTAHYRQLFDGYRQPQRYTCIDNLDQHATIRHIESALLTQIAQ